MTAAWRSELLKITTVRGFWLGAAFATLATPFFSLLVVATGGLGTDDTITSGAATGSLVGLLAFGAWGATVAASEYARQTMTVSLTTVPRRTTLYLAKVAATATVAAIGALVAAVASLAIVRAITPSDAHHLGHPLALIGIVLSIVAVTILGTAAGMFTRSSTAAITTVAVAVLLPKAAAGLLGGLQPWVIGASPGTVVTQLVNGAQLAKDQTYPPGTAAAVVTMLAVAAVAALVGLQSFVRRDG